MFNLFKKKSELDKLQEVYKKLLEEAYNLSKTDRSASDAKQLEASKVLQKIETLKSNEKS